MHFFINEKKGQSLLTILIVSAVLIIMAAVLSDSAFIDFTSSKADNNNGYAYYSAESAIEMCIDDLDKLCSDSQFFSSKNITFDGTHEDDFSKSIINYLNQNDVDTLRRSNIFQNIKVSGDDNRTAYIQELNLQLDGTIKYDSPYMYIPVGITAVAVYKPLVGNAETRRVYAIKTLKVYAAKLFELRGAVYTIGDMITSPSSITNITGDVFVYGSSPDTLTQSTEDSYGGIIATTASSLSINGNAYSRSYIRTGALYTDDNGSRITIQKDAIAQGIQVFSNNSSIDIYRDAYTFDDLEMDGQNSVIAVNGNYFGLSKGQKLHDQSSAIVNSASIYSDSDAAKLSRIVVNGDVMINGGTFKFDPTNSESYGQTEDASVAWLVTSPGGILEKPLYNEWNPDLQTQQPQYHSWLWDLTNQYGYGQANYSLVKGFGNLLQLWSPRTDSQISDWITDIDKIRNDGTSDPGSNNFSNGSGTVHNTITGFCNYEMAANDTMYYASNGTGFRGEDAPKGLSKAQYLNNNFKLDILNNDSVTDNQNNLRTTTGAISAYWKGYWNDCFNTAGTADDGWSSIYLPTATDLLDKLLEKLRDGKSPFYTRKEYDDNNNPQIGTVIQHTTKSQFEILVKQLDDTGGVAQVHSGASNVFSKWASGVNQIPDPLPSQTAEYYIPKAFDTNHLHLNLLVNSNPRTTLIMNGTTFDGIIFTAGKIILKNGATVNGAIIAAGQGYSPNASDNYVSGSAYETSRVSRITDANKSLFENGAYAAVQFEGGTNSVVFDLPSSYVTDPGIDRTDPKLIRDYYISTFNNATNGNIDLSNILK